MGWQDAPVVDAPAKPAGGGWQSAPIEAPAAPVALSGIVAPKSADAAPEVSTNVVWAPGQAPPPPDLLDRFLTSAAATANGLSATVPFLQNTTDAIGGTVSQLTGGSYDEYVNRQKKIREELAQTAPLARLAGEFGGYMLGGSALAGTKLGAEALGLTGSIGQRIANSAMSGAGLSTLDALSRGETGGDALASGAIGGMLSGALPIAGAGARLVGGQVKQRVIDPVATMLAPENAVTANLGKAIGADVATGSVMSSADEAIARQAGVPVMNVDRFGPATRRLARTASNIDDEAKSLFSRTIDDRFAGQTERATNFVKQLMNGAVDDLALQDTLRAQARVTNKAAYDKAYSSPQAKAIWSPEIRNLMTATPFKQALREADEVAANEAAVTGHKAIRNPFVFDADGNVTGLRKLPGGGYALPNLEYWDIVQRTLRSKADAAAAGGDRLLASQIREMRSQLLKTLDSSVPEFKKAREGAAGFFGAEDAIDLGRKAFASNKQIPEMARAVASLSKAEKDAASVGYASELLDNIRASGDNRNLAIANFFNSPAARARNELFLGQTRARQLEAYVRVEQTVDMLRGAVKGNSSTAEQLIAAGAVGTGVGIATGDWQQGITAGALAGLGFKAMKAAGKNVDEQVMRKVAEALLSDDPKVLERAIQTASMSKAHMDALEGLMQAVALMTRAGAVAAVN